MLSLCYISHNCSLPMHSDVMSNPEKHLCKSSEHLLLICMMLVGSPEVMMYGKLVKLNTDVLPFYTKSSCKALTRNLQLYDSL